jgi:hypothetical protein
MSKKSSEKSRGIIPMISNRLISLEDAQRIISTGRPMLFAADNAVLRQLDRGSWIGGTIPYFMTRDGGLEDTERVFATELPDGFEIEEPRFYTAAELPSLNKDGPKGGVSFIIMPAESIAHTAFAANAPMYSGYLLHPVVGWVSGVRMSELGKVNPKVYLGSSGESSEQDAVVMHCRLPKKKRARIDIVNVFQHDPDEDTILFEKAGFTASRAIINGRPQSLSRYLMSKDIDIKLPLVSNLYGAMVNVSFREVDVERDVVKFYAPVFQNQEYKIASPIADYAETFFHFAPQNVENIIFSCNCILNYMYAGLEGKQLGQLYGPITFGEIAYQLVNQTLVYVTPEIL